MRIPVDSILKTTLQSLRCLVGTHGENFDSSVDNDLHLIDWYEDAPMVIRSELMRRTYNLMETEMFSLTDPMTATHAESGSMVNDFDLSCGRQQYGYGISLDATICEDAGI